MPSERDKASENPYEASRHPSGPEFQSAARPRIAWSAVFVVSLPAIAVAVASLVIASSLWPHNAELVGFGIDPLVLGLWVTLACAVGAAVAIKRNASALRTTAAIVVVHLVCFAVIFVSLVLATFSAM